jgi:hypothetical protein
MLDADVLVLEPIGFGLGALEHLPQGLAEIERAALDARLLVQLLSHRLHEAVARDAELLEQRDRDSFRVLEQSREQVLGRQLLVAALAREPLTVLDRLLGLDGEMIEPHAVRALPFVDGLRVATYTRL